MAIEHQVLQFWSEINHAYNFRPNYTPLSSITTIYPRGGKVLIYIAVLQLVGLKRGIESHSI